MVNKMETKLDKVKTTITISLGTKNRLRALKGSASYEGYINYLLRKDERKTYSQSITSNSYITISDNTIDVNLMERKTAVYSFEEYKTVFSYNRFNKSNNFQFDIKIDKVTKTGESTELPTFFFEIKDKINTNKKNDLLTAEYRIYFELLSQAIKNEIEPQFKHHGTFEDYFSWKEELRILGLPDSSFNEDILQKLENFKRGQHYYD